MIFQELNCIAFYNFTTDPEEAEVNKVIRADVVTSTHGDDVCRNKCVANPECQSYNLAQLSELEFYCELTKYFYTDTDMVKTDQTDEGKDNWSFLVSSLRLIILMGFIHKLSKVYVVKCCLKCKRRFLLLLFHEYCAQQIFFAINAVEFNPILFHREKANRITF